MITKSKDCNDIHELCISQAEFERREKMRESIYGGAILNRRVRKYHWLVGKGKESDPTNTSVVCRLMYQWCVSRHVSGGEAGASPQ